MPDVQESAMVMLNDMDQAIVDHDMESARVLASQLHNLIARDDHKDEMSSISEHLSQSLERALAARESLKAELKTALGKRHGVSVYQHSEQ